MRLVTGIAIAALTGLTVGAASQEPAEVYILSPGQDSSSQTSTPQIPRQVARDILFQRVGGEASYSDLPDSVDEETSLSYILRYGGSPAPLFEEQQRRAPHLLVFVEGVTSKNLQSLKEALSADNVKPAFTVSDPPSASANRYLVDVDFRAAGIAKASDPIRKASDERSLVLKFDASKEPASVASLLEAVPLLVKDARQGDAEVTLVLMPETSRNSKLSHWTSSAPSQLQRRQSGESVLTEGDVAQPKKQASTADNEGAALPWATTDPKATIPSCFQSYNSCVTATGNCSGHGQCADKYAIPGKGSGEVVCFHCQCQSTYKYPEKGENSPTIHWGGNTCQKIDVSSPFWLIAGLTIVLVGIVSMCIGMLFSVGEEKLPGVIGAGVSRSK